MRRWYFPEDDEYFENGFLKAKRGTSRVVCGLVIENSYYPAQSVCYVDIEFCNENGLTLVHEVPDFINEIINAE